LEELKLPATIAIKHQIRKLMFEDLLGEAEAIAKAEVLSRPSSDGPLPAEKIA
jgi:hypothetical protein